MFSFSSIFPIGTSGMNAYARVKRGLRRDDGLLGKHLRISGASISTGPKTGSDYDASRSS